VRLAEWLLRLAEWLQRLAEWLQRFAGWLQRLVWLAVAGSAKASHILQPLHRSLYSLLSLLNRSSQRNRFCRRSRNSGLQRVEPQGRPCPLSDRANRGGVFFGSLPWTTGSSKMVGAVISLHGPKALTREYRSESRELNGAIHPCPGRLRPGITPTFMSRTRNFTGEACTLYAINIRSLISTPPPRVACNQHRRGPRIIPAGSHVVDFTHRPSSI
jgi:hypothetical protein